jgi:hypothetical protein
MNVSLPEESQSRHGFAFAWIAFQAWAVKVDVMINVEIYFLSCL